jgi:putative transposase
MTYHSIKDDSYFIERLQQLATEHPREGFWKCHFRIRNSGEVINHKRLHRLYQQLNLPLRRKHKTFSCPGKRTFSSTYPFHPYLEH